jgi:hypothetical protein
MVTWLCVAGAVAGCQSLVSDASRPSGDASDLIRYGNEVRSLDAGALEEEYRRLVTQYDAAPTIDEAVRLSLLLSNPNAAFYDANRAMRLLSDETRASAGDTPGNEEFARFVRHLLGERACVATEDAALADMLVEQRARNRSLDQELARVQEALLAERQHRETLQAQLNALRALEEQLNRDNLQLAE